MFISMSSSFFIVILGMTTCLLVFRNTSNYHTCILFVLVCHLFFVCFQMYLLSFFNSLFCGHVYFYICVLCGRSVYFGFFCCIFNVFSCYSFYSQQAMQVAEIVVDRERRAQASRANIWDMLTNLPVVCLHIYAPRIYVG